MFLSDGVDIKHLTKTKSRLSTLAQLSPLLVISPQLWKDLTPCRNLTDARIWRGEIPTLKLTTKRGEKYLGRERKLVS